MVLVLSNKAKPPWDNYFLNIARAASIRSSCVRRNVGAVLVKGNRILSTGYNDSPSGGGNCFDGACPRGLMSTDEVKPYSDYGKDSSGHCISTHAEVNCVHGFKDVAYSLGVSYDDLTSALRSCTIYVTDKPCRDCSRFLGMAGFTSERIIWPGSLS